MYKAVEIADYFLQNFGSVGNITPMKLNKLVYIAHGWSLAVFDKPLITEFPEAWKYGPVIPSIYHNYKSYGNQVLSEYSITQIVSSDLPELIKNLLNNVWRAYGQFSGPGLSSLTHQANTPWYFLWNSIPNAEGLSLIIPEDLIKEHYKSILENNRIKKRSQEKSHV